MTIYVSFIFSLLIYRKVDRMHYRKERVVANANSCRQLLLGVWFHLLNYRTERIVAIGREMHEMNLLNLISS